MLDALSFFVLGILWFLVLPIPLLGWLLKKFGKPTFIYSEGDYVLAWFFLHLLISAPFCAYYLIMRYVL